MKKADLKTAPCGKIIIICMCIFYLSCEKDQKEVCRVIFLM